MDKILERQVSALVNGIDPYITPEELGRAIMPVVVRILQKPETVSYLSDGEKNWYLQRHQAGFLAYMMKHFACDRSVITVRFLELQDFDCVIREVTDGGAIIYMPVQLKQLANHEKSKNLQVVIDQLKSQYPRSSDLVVAIWINRDINLEFNNLDFRGLYIEQLWFFGDSIIGELTLDGGRVSDLVSGRRLAAVMKDGKRTVSPVRFKPH
jgi:hypothetical protein